MLQATVSATRRGPTATSWQRQTSRQVGLPWGVVQTHAAVVATHSVLDHHLYITTRSMQAGWKGVSCCAPAPSPRGRQGKQTRNDCRRISMCLTCRHATCQAWAPPWVSLPGVLVALLPPPWARLACLAVAASSCALLAWITCTHARQPASLPAAQEASSLAGCRTCMTANNTDGVAPLLMHLTQLTLAILWRTPQCTQIPQRTLPCACCVQPNKDEAGNEIHYGENDPADLWGPEGWCTAEKPKFNCPCILVRPAV